MGNIDFQGSKIKLRIGPVDLTIDVPKVDSAEAGVLPETFADKKNRLLEERKRIDDELKGLEESE